MTTTTIPRFTSVAIQKIADWSGMIGSSIEKEGKITDEYVVPWIKAVGTSIKYSGSVVERIFDLARRPTDKNLTKSDILVITYNFISDTIYALEAITDQILDTVFDKLKKQAENDQNKLKERDIQLEVQKITNPITSKLPDTNVSIEDINKYYEQL